VYVVPTLMIIPKLMSCINKSCEVTKMDPRGDEENVVVKRSEKQSRGDELKWN